VDVKEFDRVCLVIATLLGFALSLIGFALSLISEGDDI
jgi:hypothetical protein